MPAQYFVGIGFQAGIDLAAIAAARHRSRLLGIADDDARTALGEVQRRRQACETGTDDEHVGALSPASALAGGPGSAVSRYRFRTCCRT